MHQLARWLSQYKVWVRLMSKFLHSVTCIRPVSTQNSKNSWISRVQIVLLGLLIVLHSWQAAIWYSPIVCLSVLYLLQTWIQKGRGKPTLVWTFPRAKVMGVPIFSSKVKTGIAQSPVMWTAAQYNNIWLAYFTNFVLVLVAIFFTHWLNL